MKNKYLDKYIKETYLSYFLVLINVNYLFQWIVNRFYQRLNENGKQIQNFDMYVFAIIISLIEILIIGVFIYGIKKKNYEELANRSIYKSPIISDAKRYSALLNNNLLKYDIFSFDFITQKEKNIKKGNEIWIITGDLEEDVNNENLGDIIHNNLEKGVTYRYFISKVNNKISKKASAGRDALKANNNRFWDSRLFVTEINSELVAPDIDIIIYNATSILSEREGYVCVEIGEDQNTYAYQKLSREIITDLYGKLKPKNLSIKNKSKNQQSSRLKKLLSIAQIVYWIITVGIFTILSINKIASLKTILGAIIPSILLWIFTALSIEIIDVIFDKSFEKLETIDNERKLITDVMAEQPIAGALSNLILKEETRVFSKMNLGTVSEIINVGSNCQIIWLLTDLSHDIASDIFIEWLKNQLNQYSNIKCIILHTGETSTLGRLQAVEDLVNKYPDRINRKQIDNFQNHYIWSETYGIIFVQNHSVQSNELYISLGTAEKSLFKKVEISESESANVAGILRSLY